MKQIRDDLTKLIGLAVAGLVIVGAIVLAVYAVIGAMTDSGRHLLATALVFAVPLAYVLGLQVAKSHRRGIERGLDLKLGARERAAHATKQSPRFDDYLPNLTGTAIIVKRSADSQEIIDL